MIELSITMPFLPLLVGPHSFIFQHKLSIRTFPLKFALFLLSFSFAKPYFIVMSTQERCNLCIHKQVIDGSEMWETSCLRFRKKYAICLVLKKKKSVSSYYLTCYVFHQFFSFIHYKILHLKFLRNLINISQKLV